MKVRAKKHLGQHFLKDKNLANEIVNSLPAGEDDFVLEIGPGTGILTDFLLKKYKNLYVIELDDESVEYLDENYPELDDKIFNENFLKFDIDKFFNSDLSIIGNFPYNISSQILFKVLEHRNKIPFVVGMFQKEVAERIAAPPGNKTYGILSVLVQAFYSVDYLYTVSEFVFDPPPRVKSGVLLLKRREVEHLDCNEKLFFRVVKTAFNQRRKTLRNSLKSINKVEIADEIMQKRPEQLSVEQFVYLTNLIDTEVNLK